MLATQAELQAKIQKAEEDLRVLKAELEGLAPAAKEDEVDDWKWPLRSEEYERYGRQLIIPSVGVEGQLRLKNAKVLLVGAGGLGCPAAAYLAGAGAGTVGVVDGDVVEASNLHRQIAHTTARVGMKKVESLVAYLRELNPNPTYNPHPIHLTSENAESIISAYDIVLDCTDHPTSRYLISDMCVLLSKPLVSASAFRTDGQLIVLNSPPFVTGDLKGGPCYRCIFPRPPPTNTVVSCGEGGILGPVVGTMGVLQALECIRVISAGLLEMSGKTSEEVFPSSGEEGGDGEEKAQEKAAEKVEEKIKRDLQPTLHIFSFTSSGPSFRAVRMRGRRQDCFACGAGSELTLKGLREGGVVDYVQFCGVEMGGVDVLEPGERISAGEFARRHASPAPGPAARAGVVKGGAEGEKEKAEVAPDHFLLDVRDEVHYDIASIPGSVNVPMPALMRQSKALTIDAEKGTANATTTSTDKAAGNTRGRDMPTWLPHNLPLHAPIYVVCRVGNDSQVATKMLKDMGLDEGGGRFVGDIKGGMRAWKEEVDGSLPLT